MSRDIYALETNKTWIIVQLPSGKVSIGCNWVYKIKYKVDGSFECYKTRLMAKGFNYKIVAIILNFCSRWKTKPQFIIRLLPKIGHAH